MSPVQAKADLEQNLAALLFQNECGGKMENLVYWSPKEPFPSLGIAHFIWLPSTQKSLPFKETFPDFIHFYRQKAAKNPDFPVLPLFLQTESLILPWQSREDFLQADHSPQRLALQQFLWQTRRQQAEFVVARFWQQWQKTIQNDTEMRQQKFTDLLKRIMASEKGILLILDYANFKGLGHNSKEQYHGQGWGVFEVLQGMLKSGAQLTDDPWSLAVQFIQVAKQLLKQRVHNAPKLTNGMSSEQHWQQGWFARLDKMRQIVERE